MKLKLHKFQFPDHTKPNGFLSRDDRAQACWYFYLLAQKQREIIGDSTEDQFGLLEGSLWMNLEYEQTARTVAMIYGLDSPDEFAKAWGEVKAEALACGLPEPHWSYTKGIRIALKH